MRPPRWRLAGLVPTVTRAVRWFRAALDGAAVFSLVSRAPAATHRAVAQARRTNMGCRVNARSGKCPMIESGAPRRTVCGRRRSAGGQGALARECLQAHAFVSYVTATSTHTHTMLRWTLLFLVIAIIAGLLGFTGVAGTASEIAKVLFFVFLVLLVISALMSAFRGRPPV